MPSQLRIERLALQGFRNLEEVVLEPAPRLNLVFGDNGHGKTSLIEALYVLSTTRSFRSSHLGEVVRDGDARTVLRARSSCLGLTREHEAEISLRGRSFRIDGKRPRKALDYARQLPVVAFHPGDLLLVTGPASARRTLLDRVAVYVDAPGVEARLGYQEAQRARQRVLVEQGPRASELDAYERVLAQHGVRFLASRRLSAERVIEALVPAFERMAASDLEVRAEFSESGTDDVEVFARELAERRVIDLARGAASYGPHKVDLVLSLGGRVARTHASQGQQRLLTIALKLAELRAVSEATDLEPILLLDDVSSELDPERTLAVFSLLDRSASQIFVTTTRPELFAEVVRAPGERADFSVVRGRVSRSFAGAPTAAPEL